MPGEAHHVPSSPVRSALSERHWLPRYGAALLMVLACFGIRLVLDPWLGEIQPFTLFYVAVAAATAFGGIGPGVASLVVSAALAEYWFIAPRHTLSILQPGSLSGLLLLVHGVVGGLIVTLVHRFRRLRYQAMRTAEELGEANALLHFSMDAADQGCIEWEQAGDRLVLSPRAAALHGMPGKRDLTLSEFQARVAEKDRLHVCDALRGTAADKDLRLDYQLAGAGEPQWLHLRARARPGSGCRRVTGIVTNVTEDRRLVAALHDKHAFLETIFSSAEIGLCLADEEGRFVRVNAAFARIFEYSPEDLVGRHYSILVPPGARSEVEGIRVSHLGGSSEAKEFPGVTRNGHLRHVRVSGSRLVSADGRTLLLSAAADVTEARRLMLALQESELRFRVLADDSPLVIWVTNSDGAADFVNQRYLQFFGCTLDQLHTQGWQPFIHPEDRAQYVDTFRRAIHDGGVFRAQARMRDAAGRWRWVEAHGVPRFGDGAAYIGHVGCCVDVTDVKAADAALHDLNATLEQRVAERTARLNEMVSELEEFSYTLAHDLRSPLLVMRGYADVLLESCGAQLDAEALHHVRRISTAANRLDELMRNVMYYNCIVRQDMPLGPVDVSALLEEVFKAYPRLSSRRQYITCQDPLPWVRANAGGLTQALASLLDNAVKFVPLGVAPAVRLRVEPGTLARVGAGSPAGSARLLVEDNGIGIDPSLVPQLFKLFQRLHREGTYDGAGMGLAIARKCVERMGGEIGVVSTPGRGSCFWIELPLATPVVAAKSTVSKRATDPGSAPPVHA